MTHSNVIYSSPNVNDANSPIDGLILFMFITIISLLLTCAGQYLLLSDELYINALGGQMTYEQIQKTIARNHEWSWLSYCIIPLFNLLKFTLVASCISLGYYFATDNWIFRPFFRIAIQAELVFMLPSIIKLLWFLFVQPDYTLHDLQFFYPLSLLNLVESTQTAPWLAYPLQLGNVFELTYWLVLAYGIMKAVNIPMRRALGLVVTSYGSGLLLWVVFVMFIMVSLL